MTFETQHLMLRPWREDDAEYLYKYAKDPAVGLPAGWSPHTSVDDSREIIRTILRKSTVFAVCQKNGHPIGNVHLDFDTPLCEQNNECELGYWLGQPFWGQGLIPEAARALLLYAFEDLGVRTVWCGYYDGNEQSRRVQEKLGFVHHHTDTVQDITNQSRSVHRTQLTKDMWMDRQHTTVEVQNVQKTV